MIFFCGDTHFNHPAIADIRSFNGAHGCIGFQSTKEHDEFLIYTWNSFVHKHDEVWHLGDFGFGTHDTIRSIRARLNGKIHLILGGHDIANRLHNIKDCWTSIDQLKTIKINHQKIVLCHWQMYVWDCSHYGTWMLYAHNHNTINPIGKQHNVCLDVNGFRLLSFMDIEDIMKTREDNHNLIKK